MTYARIHLRLSRGLIALCALSVALLVFSASALASGRPLLETKPATVIRGTEATLNAVVNANGVETKYYFEYGLKAEKAKYEHKTAETSTPASETNIQGSKAISELTAKTEYRFRVIATNSNGTTDGEEETFTTTALAKPEFELSAGQKFPVTLEGSFPSRESRLFRGGEENELIAPCGGVNASGSITGAKALSLTLKLTDCREREYECKTEGASEREYVFSGAGTLVYISKAKKEVGVLWELKAARIVCSGGFDSNVKGSIVVPLTPVNGKTIEVKLHLQTTEKRRQEVTEYENEKGELKKAELEISVNGDAFEEGAIDVGSELNLRASKELTVSG